MNDPKNKSLMQGLEVLLELDGEVFPMDNGYWTKIEARLIEPNCNIPHGVKYSLTLHDDSNKRIIGYDNAHGIKLPKKKLRATKIEWDHKHQMERLEHYDFENAGQLMKDFWEAVNAVLKDL